MKKLIQKTMSIALAATIGLSSLAQAAPQDKQATLWGTSVSPYVRKVQVVMDEKQIPYNHQEILPTVLNQALGKETPLAFTKASPLGKIPAFEYQGHAFADSSVISAYVNQKFSKGPSLYPANAENRAKALWFENYADNIFGEVASKKIFVERVVKPQLLNAPTDEAVVKKAIEQELPSMLDYLEQQVKGKQWLAGDALSIADIAIVTHFVSLKKADYTLDAKRWPNLAKYVERVLARDSFAKHLA